jgi:hypothetical protein
MEAEPTRPASVLLPLDECDPQDHIPWPGCMEVEDPDEA